MKLKHFWIEDFKNLKNFSVDFEKGNGLTMLIGTNGSGKSNILEAIGQIFKLFLYSPIAPHSYVSATKFSLEYEIDGNEIELTNVDSTKANMKKGMALVKKREYAQYLPSNVIAIYSGEETRLWDEMFQPAYKSYIRRVMSGGGDLSLKMTYISKYHWGIALFLLYFSGMPTHLEFLKKYLKIENIDSVRFEIDRTNMDKINNPLLTNFVDKIDPNQENKIELTADEVRSRICDQVFYMIDEPFMADEGPVLPTQFGTKLYAEPKELFNILVQSCLPKGQKAIPELSVKFKDALSVHSLSEGEKKLLLVIFALDVVADEKAIVLFDEPDAYVHESRKEELFKMMKQYTQFGRQIVLTTHSPTLANIAEENQICALKNIDGLPHIISTQELKQYKDFVGNLENVLSEKSILVTEGPDDIGYIKKAIEMLNSTNRYDTLKFDFAYTGGTNNVENFKTNARDLLNGRKLIFIFDGDDAGVKALCKAIGKQAYDANKHEEAEKANTYIKSRDRNKIYSKSGITYLLSKKPTDSEDNWTIEDYLPKALREQSATDCMSETNGYMLNFPKDLQGAVKKRLYRNLDMYSAEDLKGFEIILDSLLEIVNETADIEEG